MKGFGWMMCAAVGMTLISHTMNIQEHVFESRNNQWAAARVHAERERHRCDVWQCWWKNTEKVRKSCRSREHTREEVHDDRFMVGVTERSTDEVRQKSPWTAIVGICTESREQAGESPQRWRYVLKTRGMNAGFFSWDWAGRAEEGWCRQEAKRKTIVKIDECRGGRHAEGWCDRMRRQQFVFFKSKVNPLTKF